MVVTWWIVAFLYSGNFKLKQAAIKKCEIQLIHFKLCCM